MRKKMQCAVEGKKLPRDDPILSLSPYVDKDGLLRVGGRLNNGEIHANENNPIIIPGRHHIATLLVRHYQEEV